MSADKLDNPIFGHRSKTVELVRRKIGERELRMTEYAIYFLRRKYSDLLKELRQAADGMEEERWYVPITAAYRELQWLKAVDTRYSIDFSMRRLPVELHVVRIGDAAVVSAPFELGLDWGIRIQVQSPAVQTFVVQLTGMGGYLSKQMTDLQEADPVTLANTPIGSPGGSDLLHAAEAMLRSMWTE